MLKMLKNLVPLLFICSLYLFWPLQGWTDESPDPAYRSEPRLGVPPTLPEPSATSSDLTPRVLSVPSDRTGEWSVDISNRQESRAFFNSVYLASEGTPSDWNGDVASCSQGTTSSDFKNSVLVRINYFREMAGVPSDIIFDSTYSLKSQQAALLMSRNEQLSHDPPAYWDCYTEDGAEAAGSSNLSLGNYGWDAIDGQMRDNGSTNTLVGHRRWILYPQTEEMGTGDVPPSDGDRSSNSLWVFDGNYNGTRRLTREPYVAWPPPGFVPYQIVPARWSFSYPGADFSTASVSMTSKGATVPVAVHSIATGYGENTLAWVVNGLDADQWYTRWPILDEDATYDITVSNYIVQGVPNTTSYDVTVYNPSVPSIDEETPLISGPTISLLDIASDYSITPVSFAESYEVMLARVIEEDFFDGGESGTGNIIDNTSAFYQLLTSGAASSGSHALHLAHPNAVSENFEIDKTFVPTSTSTLYFDSRLGYSTSDESVQVQLSRNDGISWETVYLETGCGGFCQNSFTPIAVPLGEFADSFIRIRFLYHFGGGSYYSCSTDNCGLLVDDIRLEDVAEVVEAAITPVVGTAFDLIAAELGNLILAARVIPWEGYPGIDWGPFFYLTMKSQIELSDAIDILRSLESGSTRHTLTDVIEILKLLNGN